MPHGSRGYRGGGAGGGSGDGPDLSDDFSIQLKADDFNTAPTDADTYQIALEQSDTNAGHTEAVSLTFPSGNFGSTNAAPTEGSSFTVRVWLASNAAVDGAPANVANADGQNDGAVCTLETNVAGSNEESINSDIGAVVPGGLTISSVTYRGWFTSENTLVTSKGEIWAESDTAAFSDILVFRNQDLNTTFDHSSGDFTFDLYAAGVDTSAKLSSLQIRHYVNDAVAGVTPHTMTVDAGAVDVAGAFS